MAAAFGKDSGSVAKDNDAEIENLHHKLADFGMQLLDTGFIDTPRITTTPGKCRGHVFNRRPFPRPDLRRVHAIRL